MSRKKRKRTAAAETADEGLWPDGSRFVIYLQASAPPEGVLAPVWVEGLSAFMRMIGSDDPVEITKTGQYR